MIKVLRIINRFNLGGPTYNAAYLTKYLSSEYTTLLVGGVPEKHETDSLHIVKSLNIEQVIIPEMSRSINPLNDVISYRKIKQLIKEFKPDIVHTHASKAGLLGRIAAIQEKVPVIVHTFHGHVFHSYFNPLITRLFIGIERYLANKSSAIVAISELQKRELTEQFRVVSNQKCVVIPLGLDLKRFSENKEEKRIKFRKQYNIPEDVVVIGIVGRLVPIKNHRLILDAFRILKSRTNKRLEILIVGDGETKNELIQYTKELGLKFRTCSEDMSADVYFTSWIKEMDEAYSGMDIVALCSKNEGTPVSLLEAQASGKMIVTTNVGGVKDIVHSEAGYIVDDFSVESFADALEKAVAEYEERNRRIEEKVSPQIIQQYSYEILVNRMDALYKNLMGLVV
ncbi:MAG: glycosyl transferase family 1 [Bacteroidia bacterium]|nr:MAG: glycosyl transferase family 1 [Bacteroidia bacterium]